MTEVADDLAEGKKMRPGSGPGVVHVAIQRSDGGVSIMHVAAGANPEIEVARWRIACAHLYGYVGHHFITLADAPADREYRNAWTSDGRKITHDMAKARDLHREKMRRARKPRLEQLDLDYLRADELGDAKGKREAVAKKQALRDVTEHPDIAAAQTIEDLKKVWPEILGPKGD